MGSKDNVADNDHFQICEMIREESFERVKMFSRLSHLKHYYLYRHNDSTVRKMDILNHLHHALDNFSFANKPHKGRAIKSCTTKEELHNNKKLNYMMLYGSRNLAEEKQLLRNRNMCHKTDDASSSPLIEIMKNVQMKYISYNRLYKQNNCDKLLKEIKHFEVTSKKSTQLKQSIRNQVKVISDELMEMRKQKHALETKIKHVDREIEVIYAEIKSFQKYFREENCRKDASLFMLQQMKRREYWLLKCSNLEYKFIHFHNIYLEKSLPQGRSVYLHSLWFNDYQMGEEFSVY